MEWVLLSESLSLSGDLKTDFTERIERNVRLKWIAAVGLIVAGVLIARIPAMFDDQLPPQSSAYDQPIGDVDCADMSGPVVINGSDPHGLDADNDGIGCE